MFSRRQGSRFNRGRIPYGGGIFDPSKIIGATRRFWHDAQDDATYSGGTWTDKFGNGYNVAQGTGSARPTKSTAAFGGRQSLLFTAASSQELVLVDSTRITNMVGGTDVPYQVYLVAQLNTVAINVLVGFDSTVSSARYSLHGCAGAAGQPWLYQRRDGGAALARNQTGNDPAAGTPYIMRLGYTGTDANWTVNGVALTTAGSSDTNALVVDRLIYGSFGNGAGAHSAFFDGYIGEAIGVSGAALAAWEETMLINYLKAKWGIAF